jgi:amino acid adenylation domain-containing protein
MSSGPGARPGGDNPFDVGQFRKEFLFLAEHQDIGAVVSGISRQLSLESVVLDAGCGDGRLATALAPHAGLVVGFDLSPEMIASARRRACEAGFGNVRFLVGDISDPPFAPASFDLVVSSFALHETSLDRTLPGIAALLRPGGLLYFQEPCGPESSRCRHLWYRWQAFLDAREMLRRHGPRTAWRIFRFQQSRAWIDHQADDSHWPFRKWSREMGRLLPGALLDRPRPYMVSVLWKRPEGDAMWRDAGTDARSGPEKAIAARSATTVLRSYPRPGPEDHVPFPREAIEGSVGARFEEMAKRYEGRIALRISSRQWTYAELNADANRIAHEVLARAGDGPVAVLMDQDDPAVPCLLGTLKAGKAYVFLDPNDDSARWQSILSATGAKLLITTVARKAGTVSAYSDGCTCLAYEDLDGNASMDNPDLDIGPDCPAAIFFTSGSTGQPKGVVRDHRQFLHSTWLNTNTYFVAPSDRQSLLYFPGFTASVPNIYDTLLNGATLCAANPRRMSPHELSAWVRAERITHFNPPVGLWRNVLEAVPVGSQWPDLRLVTLAGQAIYGSDARAFQERFGEGAVLLFVLAMTEAGAITQGYVDGTVKVHHGPVPAGFPVADKEIVILDDADSPLGPGEEGRITITSAYLSLGYWQDDARTREHFRPVGDGSRLRTFRSGDRGLIRADGCLEYFGRDDSVVKVRGYRVDVGAVETALNSHPSVLSAAVVAGQWRGQETALAAYVAPRAGAGLTATSLRGFLAEKMPGYMLPDYLMLLDEMPLTSSGKIDRRGLPVPGRSRPDIGTPFVPPRTERESLLAGIWAELLEFDEIGVNDDFFELGGDSLLAMRMALAVEESLGTSVSGDIFRTGTTIAGLARALSGENMAGGFSAEEARGVGSMESGRGFVARAVRTARRRVADGPVFGSRGLPYGVGVRLQRTMVASPVIRTRFADRLPLVSQWAQELGISASGCSLEKVCMLSNTWSAWRAAAMEREDVLGHWLRISDPQGYLSPENSAGGMVLAVPHAGRMGGVLLKLFERNGRETAIVSNDLRLGHDDGSLGWRKGQARSRSEMIWRARQVLQRGGVVYISPDGLKGRQAVEVPFWGRRRPFQIGAAELAVTTEARLVPAFVRFDDEGRVWVEMTPALVPEGPTFNERVADLTMRYGQEYAVRWPDFFASMAWNHLRYNLDLPRE